MKKLITVILLFSFHANAWLGTTDATKSFSFKFSKFQGEIYQYETKASSPNEAFERAAQACFEHYKGGRHISMEYGQDIIDVCVNPRSI